MVVIVGLGNPGRTYAHTRHNVGFLVVDALTEKLKCGFRPGKGEFVAATSSFRDNDILLAKPATSMNESGIAIAEMVERYEIALEQLLIVVDDFQIPLGSLRMRPSGSDGGHNGMYSVIYHLQSDSFPRLRCGIGSEEMPHDKSLMADFVLSQFPTKEMPIVDEMVGRAAEACLSFLTDGIEKTMSLFNRKGEERGGV
jgi:PTH1 family peptidyl-tRNA hydrolase